MSTEKNPEDAMGGYGSPTAEQELPPSGEPPVDADSPKDPREESAPEDPSAGAEDHGPGTGTAPEQNDEE